MKMTQKNEDDPKNEDSTKNEDHPQNEHNMVWYIINDIIHEIIDFQSAAFEVAVGR